MSNVIDGRDIGLAQENFRRFGACVCDILKVKNIKNVTLAKKINISKSYLSNLLDRGESYKRNGNIRNPSEYVALRIAIALELDLSTMDKLLILANVYFEASERDDFKIIRNFVENGCYDIDKIEKELKAKKFEHTLTSETDSNI